MTAGLTFLDDARRLAESGAAFDEVPDKLRESVPHLEYCAIWHGQAVNGYSCQVRIGGVFTHAASSVLDLRTRRDSFEGVVELSESGEKIPWALFDIEKLIRMALHDSILAFELLASPISEKISDTRTSFAARRILEASVQSGIPDQYLQLAQNQLDNLRRRTEPNVVQVQRLVRYLLTAASLIEGEVSLNLERLAEKHSVRDIVKQLNGWNDSSHRTAPAVLDTAESLLQRLQRADTELPNTASDYDRLNDILLNARIRSDRQLARPQ